MEKVTVSSKGQIAIPKTVRDELNLSAGTKLTLEVRGREIVLSPEPAWKKLQGAGAGRDLIGAFAAFKKREREREDARP
jgi:AbrB family looped-hinge helix DNA binding protein